MERSIRSSLLSLALVALSACGGSRDVTGRELDAVRAELVKLRAETAILTDRLDALEPRLERDAGASSRARRGDEAAGAPVRSENGGGERASMPGGDRPDLEVVRLAPETAVVAGPDAAADVGTDAGTDVEGDDDALRPVLRSVAGGVVMEERSAPSREGADAVQRDYDEALSLYRDKRYEAAIARFTAFLVRRPTHELADNAMFWRGECHAAKGEHRRAAEQFQGLLTRFPKGNKAPDALLRLSHSLSSLGDSLGADQARKRLIARYPSSEAARKIDASAAKASPPASSPPESSKSSGPGMVKP